MKKVVIALIILVLSISVLCLKFFLDDTDINVETDNIEDYGEWYGLLGHTNLLIFPDEILSSDNDTRYYYYNNASSLGPSCYVYLECNYDNEKYEIELQRLKAIDGIYHDTDNYLYEAYVSLYNEEENEYEYAMIGEDQTIIYIFQRKGYKNSKRIEDKYALQTSENEVKNNEISIYKIDDYNNFKYWPDSWKY